MMRFVVVEEVGVVVDAVVVVEKESVGYMGAYRDYVGGARGCLKCPWWWRNWKVLDDERYGGNWVGRGRGRNVRKRGEVRRGEGERGPWECYDLLVYHIKT